MNAYEHHSEQAERLLAEVMPRMGGNRDSPSEREQMIGRAQAHALLAVAAATKASQKVEDFADAARQAARKRADEAETALMRCAEALAERWAADNGIDDAGVWIAHRRAVTEAAYEAVLNGLAPDKIDFGAIVHALEQ